MSRIARAFEDARRDDRAVLVTYLCAGDPNLAETPDLLLAAAEAGADILEVGVPFSDPTADGAAIQRASERSLRAGTTLPRVLEAVAELRKRSQVPIVLFGYYNPILAYGEKRLVADAKAAGVDGFLVVDLPPEEASVLRDPAVEAGLDYIPLLAPTSDAGRVKAVGRLATSFVYYVSLTGVTGAKGGALGDASERAAALAGELGRPVAVGFGIKNPSDAERVASQADGVVVGSALVEAVRAAPDAAGRLEAVRSLVGGLRRATARKQLS